MKKIILFSDGTGNSSANPHKTNVWRTYKALDTSPGSRQVVIYDNGVGTSAFTPKAILGLALGVGLARNVRELYTFLCRTYEDGDEIYAFGFSRGAFTIRVLVALVTSQGMIDQTVARDKRDLRRLVKAAYRQFRKDNFSPSFLSFFLAPLRNIALSQLNKVRRVKTYNKTRNIRWKDEKDDSPLVRFVGVWDTVDAYGLPIDELTRAWDKVVWPLNAKDRDLSTRVAQACHALALDEQRLSFEPMLWNENGSEEERIKQVWFPGAHADVGGGYPDDALAMVSLNWMLEEADQAGLNFIQREKQYYREQANGLGKIHDSRSGVGAIYRYAPRDIAHLCHEQKPGFVGWMKKTLRQDINPNAVSIDTAKVHDSVFERIKHGGEAYAPINLPGKYDIVSSKGNAMSPQQIESSGKPETHSDALERYENQSLVWVGVWQRKLLYSVSLFLWLGFISLPWVAGDFASRIELNLGSWFGPVLGTLSTVLHGLPELIGRVPGLSIIGEWAAGYSPYPLVFGAGLILLGLLLSLSGLVGSVMQSEMLYYWKHVNKVKYKESPTPGTFRKLLASVLGEGFRKRVFKPFAITLEVFAIAILILLLAAGLSRLAYTVVDGFGGICELAEDTENGLGKSFIFRPESYCFDTGIDLERGQEYMADVRLVDWSDGGIAANNGGWTDAPWFMYLWTPLRRHLFANWYQPMARIEDTLFDRYPLASTHPVRVGDQEDPNKIHMHFKARRSGRLYLYLNDAVIFTPKIADDLLGIYENNCGCAMIRISESHGEHGDEQRSLFEGKDFQCPRTLARTCLHHSDKTVN